MEGKETTLYLENQLCFPLYAASRLTTKRYATLLNELDITYPQYLVLMVLWEHGEQSVNSIGTRLLLESNTLTPLLKRMQEKMLIVRNRSYADERTVLISLTQKGTALKEQALQIPNKLLSSIENSGISESEMLQFQKTMGKLLESLKEENHSE